MPKQDSEEFSSYEETASERVETKPTVSSSQATSLLSELLQFVPQQDLMPEFVFEALNFFSWFL